jgi:hypothetical protein
MRRISVAEPRDKLIAQLPNLGEILRGSLLHRTTFHSQGCSKCARGEGHPQWVLNVNYPGGRTQQLSILAEQVPQVRQWLKNYRSVKDNLEKICELNQQTLRADKIQRKKESRS